SIVTRTKTGTQENIGNITTTALAAIQEIFGLAIAVDLTAYCQFIIGIISTAQLAIGIVKAQFYTGHTHRFTLGSSGKDDVLHAATTQLARTGLAHDPAYGINDVRFTTTIRSHDRSTIIFKMQSGTVGKRFKA